MKITDLTGKDVVHCATEEEAKRVLKLAHEAGYKWGNGTSYLEDTQWDVHERDTCYRFAWGSYAELGYYRRNLTLNIISSTEITGDDIKATNTQIGGSHYKDLAI